MSMATATPAEIAAPIEHTVVSEPWHNLQEETRAATFGMWLFLATEILFFGGLFLGYTYVRVIHPQGFHAGAQATNIWFGSINTVVLLTSSLTMVMAVQGAELGPSAQRLVWRCLAATALLGAVFIVIKGFEWHEDLEERLFPNANFSIVVQGAALFFAFYWIMTGLHGLHLTVGVILIGRFAWIMRKRAPLDVPDLPVYGLYWHFVDLMWLFLYPLLYLGARA